jgi:nucleotide-binding universal stress UspA family protein
MSTILVPIDRAAGSRAALPVAKWLAGQMHAEAVLLLCVGEPPETSQQAEEEQQALDRLLASAAEELNSIPTRRKVSRAHDPVRGILDTVAEEKIDLIVMATHARSPLSELASGSVAEDIVRAGVAPVTLVRWREAA